MYWNREKPITLYMRGGIEDIYIGIESLNKLYFIFQQPVILKMLLSVAILTMLVQISSGYEAVARRQVMVLVHPVITL